MYPCGTNTSETNFFDHMIHRDMVFTFANPNLAGILAA
jgi:hypothetical protein